MIALFCWHLILPLSFEFTIYDFIKTYSLKMELNESFKFYFENLHINSEIAQKYL